MSLYTYFLKVKEFNLEILPNGKDIFSFVICYKFYLIIQKIKAKFVIGENKCVSNVKLYEYLTLNVIPIFKFILI